MKCLLLLAALAPVAEAGEFNIYGTADCTGDAATGSPYTLSDTCTEVSSGYGTMTCDGTKVTYKAYGTSDCSGDAVETTDLTDGECKKVADTLSYKVTCGAPCFSRDNTHAILASGESVLMTSLKSGDIVMDGPHSSTRVIVNQHAKADTLTSGLLKIEHARGDLSLTPDHVLSVDNKFVAAREAKVGTKLGESEVSRVTTFTGGIINPLTTSGKITAEGVLATTYPEWIASFALSYPVYLTVGNALSFLFPATTQAYYDSVLESFFASTTSSLKAVPAPLVAIVFHLADLLVSAGFVLYTLASLKTVLAIAAMTAMTKGRK